MFQSSPNCTPVSLIVSGTPNNLISSKTETKNSAKNSKSTIFSEHVEFVMNIAQFDMREEMFSQLLEKKNWNFQNVR